MPITYLELAQYILSLTPEMQNQHITVYDASIDEYFMGCVTFTDETCDALDPGHMIIGPKG